MLRKHKLGKQFESEISQQGALDIEDLVQLGRNIGTCPYYGSRSMIIAANLVLLPYQSLLSKSSLETLGLNLKDNVVIIDEAHNLADSLISIAQAWYFDFCVSRIFQILNSSKLESLSYSMIPYWLENVHSHIEKYFGRFCSLLGPGNRRYIQTLLVLTRAVLRVLLDDKDVNCLNTCSDAERSVGESTPLTLPWP
ncbi:hypothetical protein CRYUN_Cryun31cG0088800 [Craigia yunnanensis]